MKIVIILVPSISSINHINACGTVYFTAYFYNQYHSINVLPVCCCTLLNLDSFIHGNFFLSFFSSSSFLNFAILFIMLLGFFSPFFSFLVPLNGMEKYLA